MARQALTVDAVDDGDARSGHTAVYRIIGDLDFATTPDVYYAVDRLALAPGLAVLVLDVSEIGVMDSSGLAVLVLAHNRSLQRGFRLLIRGAPPRVVRLLALTGLDSVLTHVDPALRRAPARDDRPDRPGRPSAGRSRP